MGKRTIRVELGDRSYNVCIGADLLSSAGGLICEVLPALKRRRCALVTDEIVASHYLDPVRDSLGASGYSVTDVVIRPGEDSKSFSVAESVCERLAASGLDRSSIVVALGGGVVGDLAGFVAAVYMRGIAYVQMPTSLLAQVDSSVGGKTGVNLSCGKNLVGAFWQPRLVVIDIRTLATLSERDYVEGLAEVLKYGVIWDAGFWDWLRANRSRVLERQMDALAEIVARSCAIKAEVVRRDEHEGGLRAILNYGHTFGHALETTAGYGTLRHGEAVAIGMVAAGRLAARLGRCEARVAEEIEQLIRDYGLPVSLPYGIDINAMISHFVQDKKAVAGAVAFVLPDRIGAVSVVRSVEGAVLQEVLSEMGGRC